MNERLLKLRKYLKLTQPVFGKKLGVTAAAISKMEKGFRGITDSMIISICREYNVREEWLRNGTGDMFFELQEDDYIKAAASLSDDPFLRAIITEYFKLDDESRKLFRDFIHKLSDKMREF